MTRVIRQAPATLLAVGAAVVFSAVARAQPPAPPEPPLPPPSGPTIPIIGAPLGPQGLNVLAQSGPQTAPAGPLGVPAIPGIQPDTVLAQNAVPSAPGVGPGVPPNLRAFNNAYGVAQNEVPSAPGQGQQFDVAPGDENLDVNGRTWLGRYIDLYRDGRLRGSLLGQLPQEQLGQALPGTAPPPGTNVPPGLVQFLPPPPDPAVPGVGPLPVVPPPS